VEDTYAKALVEFAHRNYSSSDSMLYRWAYQTFAYLGIQLVPAAVLVILFVKYGGIAGNLFASPPQAAVAAGEARRLFPRVGERMRWRLSIGFATVVLVLAAIVGTFHIGRVRARRADDLVERGFKVLARSPEEAASLFAASLALKPSFLEAHDGEGAALLAAGDATRAVDAYLEALKIDPRYFPSRIGLADSLARLDRDDDAISEYGKAQELSPQRWEPYYNGALLLLKKNKLAEAEASFKRTIELNPKVPDARIKLARLLITAKRWCEAVPHLEAYLSLASLAPDSKNAALVRDMIETGKKECSGR